MRISDGYPEITAALDRTYIGSYFQSRGVSQETFDLFGLGTIPTDPRAGVLVPLRGTPAFPITDADGNILSYACRTGTAETKYYSLPYRKAGVLFGLYQAYPSILSTKTVYITEGYFDALVGFSFGVTNIVAIMGASIGVEQVVMLASMADKFIMIPDSDKVGLRSLTKNRKLISSLFPDITIDERYVYPAKDFAEYLLEKAKNV